MRKCFSELFFTGGTKEHAFFILFPFIISSVIHFPLVFFFIFFSTLFILITPFCLLPQIFYPFHPTFVSPPIFNLYFYFFDTFSYFVSAVNVFALFLFFFSWKVRANNNVEIPITKSRRHLFTRNKRNSSKRMKLFLVFNVLWKVNFCRKSKSHGEAKYHLRPELWRKNSRQLIIDSTLLC